VRFLDGQVGFVLFVDGKAYKKGLFVFEFEGFELVVEVGADDADVDALEVFYEFREGDGEVSVVVACGGYQFLFECVGCLVPELEV
jgi:hypothetical protein